MFTTARLWLIYSFEYLLQKYWTLHSKNIVHKYLSCSLYTHIHLAVSIHLHTILTEALDHIDLALKKIAFISLCLSELGCGHHLSGQDSVSKAKLLDVAMLSGLGCWEAWRFNH